MSIQTCIIRWTFHIIFCSWNWNSSCRCWRYWRTVPGWTVWWIWIVRTRLWFWICTWCLWIWVDWKVQFSLCQQDCRMGMRCATLPLWYSCISWFEHCLRYLNMVYECLCTFKHEWVENFMYKNSKYEYTKPFGSLLIITCGYDNVVHFI